MAEGNLDRLVAAGAIRNVDDLSTAERAVIDGLSEQEVATLVGVRQKLSEELGKRSSLADAEASELQGDVSPNFIL